LLDEDHLLSVGDNEQYIPDEDGSIAVMLETRAEMNGRFDHDDPWF